MTPPILFPSPHQDDIELGMGSAVWGHLRAGYEVHTLLLTTGQNSGARAKTGLDVDHFVKARDDEHYNGNRELGVRPWNIHISDTRVPDGELTVTSAEAQIRPWLEAHPDGWVKSYTNLPAGAPGTPTARHSDHANLGQATLNLLKAGEIVPNGLRHYVEPWLIAAWKAANQGLTASPEGLVNDPVVLAALDEYDRHDAARFFYGIGILSVPDVFKYLRADTRSWWHLPVTSSRRR